LGIENALIDPRRVYGVATVQRTPSARDAPVKGDQRCYAQLRERDVAGVVGRKASPPCSARTR